MFKPQNVESPCINQFFPDTEPSKSRVIWGSQYVCQIGFSLVISAGKNLMSAIAESGQGSHGITETLYRALKAPLLFEEHWCVIYTCISYHKIYKTPRTPTVHECTKMNPQFGGYAHIMNRTWENWRKSWSLGFQFMMTSSNRNIFRVTGPSVWGKSTGDRWIPLTKSTRGAVMLSLMCAWTNGWANNWDAGDMSRNRAYHDVTVMYHWKIQSVFYN